MKNIRRSDREVTIQEAKALLDKAEYGVLSTVDKEGQPYGVPLSFVYRNDGIYFHCALSGHKLENIDKSPKVSFCVVGNTKILPDKFATEYESVVVFGVASEIKEAEKHSAMLWLLEKYSLDFIEEGKLCIEQKDKATRCFKIEICHISGKARR